MQILCKVKTEEQIKNTLDQNGACSNVMIAAPMYNHCGKVYVARPTPNGVDGRWRLYDKKNRPIGLASGWPWTWVSEWLDFDAATDENDLTKILEEGYEK